MSITYCNQHNSFVCVCNDKAAALQNAKRADAALDGFDNTGAAARKVLSYPSEATDSRFANPKPVKHDPTVAYCPCDSCLEPAPVNAKPVKSKAEPTNQMYKSMVDTFDKCLSICERKCHDYASGGNPYRNFETVTRIGVTVQQGILMRTLDKITRLENLLTVAPYVTEETFEDTIDDAINYLAILKARREFERKTV